MSRPRQILKEQFYLVTRRCTQRQFLLRPDDATNNAFVYCLAVAAARHEIDVLMTFAASNHHHSVIFDRSGNCPAFVEHFHKLFARSQNALRGRWENFWAAEEPCITRLVDRAAIIDKLVYTAANPVKDQLVERVHHWPGVTSYPHLKSGRAMAAKRPRHFFRDPGPMPADVELKFVFPPELGNRDDVVREVQTRVGEIERDLARDRAQTGKRVVGRRRILEQSWKQSPKSVEPRRNLRPRFAGGLEARIPALLAYREFLAIYADARDRWLNGHLFTFPKGTYWLARFAAVPIASS